MSDDHLTTEEISALLDRGAERATESAHVEACASCRREMELLRRMRMALSALDDRDAPPGAWDSIEVELEERGALEAADAGGPAEDAPGADRSLAFVAPGWLRAAAAVLLFAGGLGLGTVLTSSGAVDVGAGPEVASAGSDDRGGATAQRPAGARAAASTPAGPRETSPRPGPDGGPGLAAAGGRPGAVSTGSDLSYREAMRRLEQLRAEGPSFREAYRNPQAAAEQLARLDALLRASREALREDPADPALNDFLFEVAEEREALNRALQLSSLEYR